MLFSLGETTLGCTLAMHSYMYMLVYLCMRSTKKRYKRVYIFDGHRPLEFWMLFN